MNRAIKTPWHLWVVAVFALVWNGMGAFDYVMTRTENAAYLSQFTPTERDFFLGIPTWAVFFWALSIWSAVLASILLLFRSKWAVPLYAISLVSFLIVSVQNYIIASPSMAEVVGTFATMFSLVIFLTIVGLWWYARRMRAQGVLQ